MSRESQMLRIEHPTVKKAYGNIKEIEMQVVGKLNIILYSRKTTLPVYWDNNFQSVDEKYCIKSQYCGDYQEDLKVGQCLYYSREEANIFIIITNKTTADHFSYQNLEKGLLIIKLLIEKNQQCHSTFIIHKIDNHSFENCINEKIVSLMCSAFIDLTPCVIIQIESSKPQINVS